jgi:hypothetical protein
MTINFDQLLRYGASGGFGVIVFLFAFEIKIDTIDTDLRRYLSEWTLVLISFIYGVLVYAVYRAFIFTTLYRASLTIAGRYESIQDIDILRWRKKQDKNSLQIFMYEWGGQIHLLNTCGMAGLISLISGHYIDLQKTFLFKPLIAVMILLFVASFISNIRYQMREKELWKHEDTDKQKIMPSHLTAPPTPPA